MTSTREQAIIDEGYRIGMQQILPELKGFLSFLRSRNVANWLEIGSNQGGFAFVLGYCVRPGFRLIIDTDNNPVRTQMLQSIPGYVRELVLDPQSVDTQLVVEQMLDGAKLDLLFLNGRRSYSKMHEEYTLYKRFVREDGIIALHDIRNSEYHTLQGNAAPHFWRALKKAHAASQCHEFLADPRDCIPTDGNWRGAVQFAEQHCISPGWGGIGAIIMESSRIQTSSTPHVHHSIKNDAKNAIAERHPFLVYIPTDGGDYIASLDERERHFDVALNNYSSDCELASGEGDFQFAVHGHKWPSIDQNLNSILHNYEYVAFIDNDISISTAQLNTLFFMGRALQLDLFQASLSIDSFTAWPKLKHVAGSLARCVDFVEIMMPIFSQSALNICRPTFNLSASGWGLDLLWAKLLKDANLAVIDAVIVGHRRPLNSHQWRNARGLSALEELHMLKQRYEL